MDRNIGTFFDPYFCSAATIFSNRSTGSSKINFQIQRDTKSGRICFDRNITELYCCNYSGIDCRMVFHMKYNGHAKKAGKWTNYWKDEVHDPSAPYILTKCIEISGDVR